MPPSRSFHSALRKPSLSIGCGVSLLAHLALMVLFAIASPAVVVDHAQRSDDPAGSIVLISPVQASPRTGTSEALAGAGLSTLAESAPVAPTAIAAPRRVPVRPRKPRPAAIVAESVPAAGTETDPPAPPGPDVPATSVTSAPATPMSPSLASTGQATPWQIPISLATSLRVEDEFPSWPEGLSKRGFPRSVSLEVCVSELGAVRDVRITSPAEDVLRDTLQRSVRRWRYRSLMMGGRARAFCHPLRIEYRHG
jgi:hypothetical protein